jgi:hypothetical protein
MPVRLNVNLNTLLIIGVAVAGVAGAVYVKRKIYDGSREAIEDFGEVVKEGILSADDSLLNVPSKLGKIWMVDILGVMEDEPIQQAKSYNWLENYNSSEWPGL